MDFSAGDSQFAQGGIRVAGLSDGGFSVVWASDDNDRSTLDGDLYGLTFRADLSATTAGARSLITDTGPTSSYPLNQAISGLNTGGFAIISSDDARFSLAQAGQNQEAALRLYDASGASVHSPIYLGTAGGVGETVTTLSDGRLVAGWVDQQGALKAQYLSSDGTLIGSSFVVAHPSGDFASRPVFSALGQGGWVATYVASNAAAGHAIFYDGAGQASTDQVIASSVTALQGVQVTQLSDGHVVAMWAAPDQANVVDIHAQIYAQDGSKVGSDILVSSDSSSVTSVAALADGGFVTALEPRQAGPTEVKVYDAAGHQTGPEIKLDGAIGPDVASLTDGGFVLAWKDSGGTFHAQAYSNNGPPVRGDLNGDGLADILWRNDDGSLTNWLGRADGGFTGNDAIGRMPGISTSWKINGFADLNGDGRSDILWRNDDGSLTDWLGTANGGYVANDAIARVDHISTSWKVAGVDDFNGDGHADILWRNDSGALTDWLSRADGGFTANDSVALIYDIPTSWKVAGVGDFNGDGRADILWRNDSGALTDWLGQANGGFVANDSVALIYDISTSWKVAGVGDFNGDGRADILWRNDSGALTDWLGQANGGFVANDPAALIYDIPTSWKVAGVEDFNGDGRADILWRNDSGAMTDWLGQANGAFVANDSVALTYDISTSWHTQIQSFSIA
ncbi:FG-GAP repeat domain-containing protein [Sphingomonas changbaiensis]|uniref:FG-GAP repeat domain-containing protein n=1 Tax=Sphingomonas changbaiensis TaxID=529705 RepID=UPI0014700AE7|nr:VCBS repeat-containing protein [Sphingomonas changbaiensis]